MVPIILIVVVAVGIAWPLLRQRGLVPGLPGRASSDAVPADGPGGVAAPRVREELCPHCSRLNPPGAVKCVECAGEMPVDSIKKLWDDTGKQELIREGVQCGALLIAMIVAMVLSYNVSTTGKLVVLLVTVAGLAWRFLRVIHD